MHKIKRITFTWDFVNDMAGKYIPIATSSTKKEKKLKKPPIYSPIPLKWHDLKIFTLLQYLIETFQALLWIGKCPWLMQSGQ